MEDLLIKSILDNDMYKFNIQNFYIKNYCDAEAIFIFNNRDKTMKYTQTAFDELRHQVNLMSNLRLTNDEYDFMKKKVYYLDDSYFQYLSSFRHNPSQVKMELSEEGDLKIKIIGKLRDASMWEIPLMALISEIYFKYVDKDWVIDDKRQINIAKEKAKKLSDNDCKVADFSTRRRRDFNSQNIAVNVMSKYPAFVGTSNPYLAMIYDLVPIGTIAHEVIMAISVLESLNHPNKYAMQKWLDTFGANLGIFLPDTYGINSFLNDFNTLFAKAFDGLRWDSGDYKEFTDKIVNHYKKLRINPMTKTITYSDSLDVDKYIEIDKYCKGKILSLAGIGTNFSNDYLKPDGTKSKAMNMVIKLDEVNGKKVCKLPDTPTKAIGDNTSIKIMKHLHFGESL